MMRCVFFDRDGVVNESPGPGRYVLDWSGFRLNPGFVDAMTAARDSGYAAAVITNQRCVAIGLLSLEKLLDMHRRLREMLWDRHGLEFLDIMFCPHDAGECECRKPKPGMLLELSRRYSLDMRASWMIGDAETDVEAGRNAGCRTILVSSSPGATTADFTASTMLDLPALMRRIL